MPHLKSSFKPLHGFSRFSEAPKYTERIRTGYLKRTVETARQRRRTTTLPSRRPATTYIYQLNAGRLRSFPLPGRFPRCTIPPPDGGESRFGRLARSAAHGDEYSFCHSFHVANSHSETTSEPRRSNATTPPARANLCRSTPRARACLGQIRPSKCLFVSGQSL